MEITNQSQVFNNKALSFGHDKASYPVVRTPKDDIGDVVTISKSTDTDLTEADFDEADGVEVIDDDNTQVTTVEDDIEDVGYGDDVEDYDNTQVATTEEKNNKIVNDIEDWKQQCLDFSEQAENSGVAGGKFAAKLGKFAAAALEVGGSYFIAKNTLNIGINGFKASTAGKVVTNIASNLKQPAINFAKNMANKKTVQSVINLVGKENVINMARSFKGSKILSAAVNMLAVLTAVGTGVALAAEKTEKQ